VRTHGSDSPANTCQDDVTLESSAPQGTDDNRVACGRAVICGVNCVFVAYSYRTNPTTKAGEWRFAYRPDSAALNTAWTQETIDTGQTCDDHVAVASLVQAGNTNSTIVVVAKDDLDDLVTWTRNAAGTWSSAVKVVGTFTRPHVVLDRSNERAYLIYTNGSGNAQQMSYRTSSLPTLSWSSASDYLDSGAADLNNALVPNHTVTATMGLMLGATQMSVGVWWNKLTITAPAASGKRVVQQLRRRRRR
jgi:hypothetical protein